MQLRVRPRTWSLTAAQAQKRLVFENMAPRRIVGTVDGDVTILSGEEPQAK